ITGDLRTVLVRVDDLARRSELLRQPVIRQLLSGVHAVKHAMDKGDDRNIKPSNQSRRFHHINARVLPNLDEVILAGGLSQAATAIRPAIIVTVIAKPSAINLVRKLLRLAYIWRCTGDRFEP